jgi:hypothetical protein
MYYNNTKIFVLFIFLVCSSFVVSAQEKRDTTATADAIIRVDGSIVYGKVVEVDQKEVKYRINNLWNGPVITLPRKLVYAISYSNSTTQIVTAKFGAKTTKSPEYDQNKLEVKNVTDSTNNLGYNIGHGDVKVGLGFSREYSSFSGVKDFSKSASAPSIYVAYQFHYNRFLVVGASLGYASFKYVSNVTSDYDGIAITQNINETIGTLGVYGRYNLMDGFIKPYLLLGLNINYSQSTLNGDVFFMEDGKHVQTSSGINGFKTNFVARAGVDFMISKSFGLYSDIGTGTSLIQLGVIFSLK